MCVVISSDLGDLRKIFKDESNRAMLVLLNEKGALTSEELMGDLNVGVRMLTYHLKVLDDFLVRTVDDKFMLSEKGKQACAILSEMPESTGVTRRWKIMWFVSIICNIVIASIIGYISNRPTTVIIMALFISSGLILSYALKVKPKITGRLLYIGLGIFVVGSLLMLLGMKFFRGEKYFVMFPPGSTGDNMFAVLNLVVCWIVGGVIGELIGRKMRYKWPPSPTS